MPHRRAAWMALAMLTAAAVGTAPALADSVVTLCAQDTQAGAGVNLAAAIAAGGTVTFSCGAGATLRITANHPVTLDLHIDGAAAVTLDASASASVLTVGGANVHLTLDNLAIAGGGAAPTIAAANAVVLIRNVTFTGNGSPVAVQGGSLQIEDSRFIGAHGTAIRATDLNLLRSRIENAAGNAIVGTGGTVTIVDSDVVSSGPGVFTGGTLAVTRSRFTANTDHGLGGGALHLDTDATIRNSVFTGNHAGKGGAIYVGGAARSLAVTASHFTSNVAAQEGGAIAVEPLSTPARSIAINHDVFRGNSAATGGAIDLGEFIENDGVLAGTANTFAGNTASGDGGAIAGSNVALQLAQAVFVDNSASGRGGAIRMQLFAPRPSVFANALIVRNKAPNGGGFVGSGAAFVNSTIAANVGGGLTQVAATPAGWRSISLRNSVVSGNAGGNCASTSPLLPFTDDGNNLQYPGRTCPASIPTADPWLDTLYIPVVGSPAFAHGDNPTCATAPVGGRDVYGQPRPQGSVCSIGAAEGDLEKQIADGTTGGPAWPGGGGKTGSGGGGTGRGGTGGGGASSGGGSSGPGSGTGGSSGSGGSCCMCLPACPKAPAKP